MGCCACLRRRSVFVTTTDVATEVANAIPNAGSKLLAPAATMPAVVRVNATSATNIGAVTCASLA